eukprot:TRINITY_DN8577_c1_g1_i2.p2 TRINITY_DN8577_c1_g1~~TRINITY_DN8577_c1_g1_i2.p2  ORF type:complete len:136 (-),score=13.92 TRINITY_DN8577_c1_g1_i2:76-483(-)
MTNWLKASDRPSHCVVPSICMPLPNPRPSSTSFRLATVAKGVSTTYESTFSHSSLRNTSVYEWSTKPLPAPLRMPYNTLLLMVTKCCRAGMPAALSNEMNKVALVLQKPIFLRNTSLAESWSNDELQPNGMVSRT